MISSLPFATTKALDEHNLIQSIPWKLTWTIMPVPFYIPQIYNFLASSEVVPEVSSDAAGGGVTLFTDYTVLEDCNYEFVI